MAVPVLFTGPFQVESLKTCVRVYLSMGAEPDTGSEEQDETATDTPSEAESAVRGMRHHEDLIEHGFKRDILYILWANGEIYGLGIKAFLDEAYEGEIHHGRLYPNIDELKDHNMIEKRSKDNRTNLYSLTSYGKYVVKNDRSWHEELYQMGAEEGEEGEEGGEE